MMMTGAWKEGMAIAEAGCNQWGLWAVWETWMAHSPYCLTVKTFDYVSDKDWKI